MTTDGVIRILERVEFDTGKDTILPSSIPVLEDVRQILATVPQIRKVRVEGHTDSRGSDRANLDLSDRRARSVVRWLTDHGIVPGRLEAQGFGEAHPIASNRSSAGRQTNRRVEFHVFAVESPQQEQ